MEKTNKILFTILIIVITFSLSNNKSFSQVTDIDGNIYKTVIIGTQVWTAENLNVEHYRNGDIIPQVQDSSEWSKLTTGAWCYYENNLENGKIYGKLYNWFAVTDTRGLAPEGWHIPGDAEWTKLIDFLGREEVAGGKLKSKILWESPNEGETNESGFSAFPGGFRIGSGDFCCFGVFGYFWSASEVNNNYAWNRSLGFADSDMSRLNFNKLNGLSCRCVKD